MNAKIRVTVPVEKLHLTVSEILESVSTESESVSIDLIGISKCVKQEHDLLKQMEHIDSTRKKLALLDANLEDCYNILSGLIEYKVRKENSDVEQPTE